MQNYAEFRLVQIFGDLNLVSLSVIWGLLKKSGLIFKSPVSICTHRALCHVVDTHVVYCHYLFV